MDRIDSALSFLREASVASYPLPTKIHYLESKGLSAQEIDQALKLSGIITPAAGGKIKEREKDWKDWFIMLVIGGAAGWLATQAARKYLLPALQPPTQNELTTAQEALEAKYEEASSLLSTLQSNNDSLKSELLSQKEAIDKELGEVRKLVASLNHSEEERKEMSKAIRTEVDAIRELIPKLIEKSKESQIASLNELQAELKSLKGVLLLRPSTSTSSSTSKIGSLNGGGFGSGGIITPRPGIPAWQLAANNNSQTSSTPISPSKASDQKAKTDSNVEPQKSNVDSMYVQEEPSG